MTFCTRLLCLWNFPGKNTGVLCHFLLQGYSWRGDWSCIFCVSLSWQVYSLPLSHLGSPAVRLGADYIKSGASQGAQRVKNLPAMLETCLQSLGQEDLWRREWQPTPVFFPRESHGQRNLLGYSPWGCKELDTTEWLHFFLSFQCS